MYIDKDVNGNFSIMGIKQEELLELGAIFREFEYLIQQSDTISDREKASMVLFSAKLRFKIIDALK